MLKCLNPSCGKEFLYAAKRDLTVKRQQDDEFESIETHVCPWCLNPDICEVEKTQLAIESIISVKICEADALIKQGYEVKDTYAATVTLIKKKQEVTK